MNILKLGYKLLQALPKTYYFFLMGKMTPTNMYRWLQGTYRLVQVESFTAPMYIQEQLWFRTSLMNKECLTNRMCPCGCEFPGKQLTDASCERNCYQPLLSEQDWKLYKDIYQINTSELERNFLDYYMGFS